MALHVPYDGVRNGICLRPNRAGRVPGVYSMSTWSDVLAGGHWLPARDADPRVVALYRRHYSADLTKDHRRGIGGPSARIILLTERVDALWVWRLMLPPEERISDRVKPDRRRENRGNAPNTYFGDQYGVMCTVFRNEGPTLSSSLVLEAEEIAWGKWPDKRLFTYVWDSRVKSKNPGYCFKVAGWRKCGTTTDGRLTILEKYPKG